MLIGDRHKWQRDLYGPGMKTIQMICTRSKEHSNDFQVQANKLCTIFAKYETEVIT